MPTLLVIDSSPMETAVSRVLTRAFVELWEARFPGGRILRRDVGLSPPPHLDALTLRAFGKPVEARDPEEAEAARLSDQMVDELEAADVIVVGSPMYNFTITSGLKAWIDLIARAGRTFRYSPDGVEGLLRDKQVFVFTARGGFYTQGSPEAVLDYQETYLQGFFNFLGLDDVSFVHAEGQGVDPDTAESQRAAAMAQVRRLFDDGLLKVA